jgi:hypothetical protein
MTEKKFWIADAEGSKACVATEADRNVWVRVLGWTEATEPVDGEFQYIRNVDHGGVGRMTHAAVALHAGLGWVPSGPPGYTEPEPPKSSPSSKPASSGDKKE